MLGQQMPATQDGTTVRINITPSPPPVAAPASRRRSRRPAPSPPAVAAPAGRRRSRQAPPLPPAGAAPVFFFSFELFFLSSLCLLAVFSLPGAISFCHGCCSLWLQLRTLLLLPSMLADTVGMCAFSVVILLFLISVFTSVPFLPFFGSFLIGIFLTCGMLSALRSL